MLAPLFLFLFGLFAIFIKGKEDPIIAMLTIFGFCWTVYEIFFKPEPTPEEIASVIDGTSKMKLRDWIEIIILIICVVWIGAAAELIE